MNAEIRVVQKGDEISTHVSGMVVDIIPIVLDLCDEIAGVHANQMGLPKWITLMAMSDTLREIAEGERHESDRQS